MSDRGWNADHVVVMIYRKRKLYIDISEYNFYNNWHVKTIADSNSND